MASIIRWNPVREMATMQSALDRIFDDTFRSMRGEFDVNGALALDVTEDNGAYTVTTALPGVDPDNIQVNLHDNTLTIQAEISEEKRETEGSRVLLQERTYGKFSRSVRLPLPVNADNIQADYENGVLKLTLPKAENAKPRQIQVRAAQAHNN